MEEYIKYYHNQIISHPKDREREFFDHLHQISLKVNDEIMSIFYHFLKRYLKTISPLIVSSYSIDFLITFLPDYHRYVLKILILFSTQRDACSRMLYLRLPTLLLQTPSLKSLALLNKLLSSSSSFEIYVDSLTCNEPKFIDSLMTMCPSYLYPQPMSSDKILQSSYHSWRYIALTGNASLIPAVDTFPTDTAFVNEQMLIKQLYEVIQTKKIEPIDNVIHVLYSPDGIVLLRDRKLIQTIRFVLDKHSTDEIIVEKCLEALQLSAVDYHCLISMLNEKLLDKFELYLNSFSSKESIILKILNVICYMCGTDALVSFVNTSQIFKMLFPVDQSNILQFPSCIGIKRKLLLIAFQTLQSKVIAPELLVPFIDLKDKELYDLTIPLSSLLTLNNCNVLLEETKGVIKSILTDQSKNPILVESALYFLMKTRINTSFLPNNLLLQYKNSIDFNIHSLTNQILYSQFDSYDAFSVLSIPISIDSTNIFPFLSLYSFISNMLITGVAPNQLEEIFTAIIEHFPMQIFTSNNIPLSQLYIAASHLITFLLSIPRHYSISDQLTKLCLDTLFTLLKSNSTFIEIWFEHFGHNYLLQQLPKYSTLQILNEVLKSKEICYELISPKDTKSIPLEERFLNYLNDPLVDISSVVKCIENIIDKISHGKLNEIAIAVVQRTEELIDSGNVDVPVYISTFNFIKKAIDCSSLVCQKSFTIKIIKMLNSTDDNNLKKVLIDVCASIYNTVPIQIRDILSKKMLLDFIDENEDNCELNCSITRCLAVMSKFERVVKSKVEIEGEMNKITIQEGNQQISFIDLISPTILMVPVGNVNDFVFVKTVENIQGYEKEFKKKFDLPDMLPSYQFVKTTWDLFVKEINKVLYIQMVYGVIDCSMLTDSEIINYITMFHECVSVNWEESIGHLALLLNLPQSSSLFKMKLNNDIKPLLFVIDTLNPTSINSILIHTESSINTWCDKYKPIQPRFNPIFSKKILPIVYLSCAQANLYKKNWDVAYQMFVDAMKAYKVQSMYNGKFFNKSVIGVVASILLDPSKRNLQQYSKEWEDCIRDSIKFIDNLDNGHYYCKELLFYHAQYFIKQKMVEKAQQIIEEIDSKHHDKIIKTEDVFSALMYDSLLKQMKMNHHRQHILYAVTAYKSPIKSFDIYCVDELAELLGVNDLEQLDMEYREQIERPHLVMQKKVQWSTLRAYVIMKKVILRDVYDEVMAKLLLRLLTYFHEHVSEADQIESVNRFDLICKAIGSPVFIPPSLPSLPVIESITLTPIKENEQIRSRVKEKSIFIYDPSMPKEVPIVWSSNETAFITIKMKNPLYALLSVDNIMPWCEGVEIQTHFKCVDILPTSSVTFEYAITPKTSGLLKIYGLEFDCCCLHFKSVPINFRNKDELTPCCVVSVVNSVPRLQTAPGTFLSKAISLFPGQTNESKLELVNDGELAVNWINFKIKDDDSTHLTEINVAKPLQDILPILPNQKVEIPLAISARGELSNIDIEINYSSSSRARFGRTFCVPIHVIVSVGLLIDKWEIIPIEEMLLVSCVVYNPSAFSFTVKIMPNPQWNVDDFFVQERRETFSESQSRRRLLVAVKKPSYTLTSKNAAKWINEVISIRWTSSSGCDGTISVAESETVAVNTSS